MGNVMQVVVNVSEERRDFISFERVSGLPIPQQVSPGPKIDFKNWFLSYQSSYQFGSLIPDYCQFYLFPQREVPSRLSGSVQRAGRN